MYCLACVFIVKPFQVKGDVLPFCYVNLTCLFLNTYTPMHAVFDFQDVKATVHCLHHVLLSFIGDNNVSYTAPSELPCSIMSPLRVITVPLFFQIGALPAQCSTFFMGNFNDMVC